VTGPSDFSHLFSFFFKHEAFRAAVCSEILSFVLLFLVDVWESNFVNDDYLHGYVFTSEKQGNGKFQGIRPPTLPSGQALESIFNTIYYWRVVTPNLNS
jgi:hypothetical protein